MVKRWEDGERGNCQSPLLASSLEKIFAPPSCASVSSTFGSGCTSLSTDLFSGFRSTQMRTFPDFFGTTTIPAHHGVSSVTLEIILSFSMQFSSSMSFGLRGSGTFLGVNSANGFASGWSLM